MIEFVGVALLLFVGVPAALFAVLLFWLIVAYLMGGTIGLVLHASDTHRRRNRR
ncbi:hypothetical protein [Microbacterium sp. 16-032]|uniref:hypothetical protein n=1 Tax=Microbacterium sp. 16-032 TaxID=3239808 RepID=UPI0034E27F6C